MVETREKKIKRLLYQSWYRGCKETDGILGNFARENLHKFANNELEEFESILKEQDWDIWNWVAKKEALPKDLKKNSVMKKLLKYEFHK